MEHCDKLSDRKLGMLTRARHLAEWIHRWAIRGTKDLYVSHCYGVEQILVILGFALDIVMRISALLHDTIEDCTAEERRALRRAILFRFGLIAYLIVEAVTRKEGKDYSKQILWYIRNFWWIGLWRAAFVKLADILFNLSTIEGFNNYRREMKQYGKAQHIIAETIIPARRFIPHRVIGKFDELLTSVTTLLPIKRQETIERRRDAQRLDESYFPSL